MHPVIGIRELAEDLDPVATRWRPLGIQLEVNVDNIDSEENRAEECLRKTLEAWKARGTATIGDVITALKSPAIGNNALAANLKQRGSQLSCQLIVHVCSYQVQDQCLSSTTQCLSSAN